VLNFETYTPIKETLVIEYKTLVKKLTKKMPLQNGYSSKKKQKESAGNE
jgi:hypothetical protein